MHQHPFLVSRALQCALANYAHPILCFLSLPQKQSITSALNLIYSFMRQASLSSPHHRHPVQRESSFTGVEAGRAMGWARIARRSRDVGRVHQNTYFDWRRRRDSALLLVQSARWIAQAVLQGHIPRHATSLRRPCTLA